MAAILSEIASKVNISALKDRLIEVYATVNDKVIRVKEALSEAKMPEAKMPEAKQAEAKQSEEKKEEPYAAPPPAPKTTKEKIFEFLTRLKDYFIIAGIFLFKSMFYIFLASLVANDMIMYAPVIRAFFFVFTLIVTYHFAPYAFFLTCYYLLRRGYDYYHQKLSSKMPKPPLSFPMIFAMLPLTTTYPESPIVRFFLWAFMYQKSDKPERIEKENDRLEIIMTEYWKDLNKSFDYLENIKTSEPFSGLYELNREHLTRDYMHPIKKPDTVVEPSEELPDVIEEKKESKNESKNEVKNESKNESKNEPKKVTFFKPQSIAQAEAEKKKEEEDKKAAANASQPKAAPLPPTIAKTGANATTGSVPPTNATTAATTGSLPPTIATTNATTGSVPPTITQPSVTTGSVPPTNASQPKAAPFPPTVTTGSLPPTITQTKGPLTPTIAKQAPSP